MWSFGLIDFHTLTLQLPIQTQNPVARELQGFVSSFEISAKRAHPSSQQPFLTNHHFNFTAGKFFKFLTEIE